MYGYASPTISLRWRQQAWRGKNLIEKDFAELGGVAPYSNSNVRVGASWRDPKSRSLSARPPKKRPKTETKGVKRGPGHRKKVAVEPACDSDDEKREVELKVVELSDDVKGRFGQDLAVKVLETKFLVFFFATNNFCVWFCVAALPCRSR
ncbi:hypothetical protein PF006_g28727 [Phytophthora fragariae]|uniref:Uncharacterized protein n=1 Tax=Phytophthora fragariae TaxID=53985 RepID=A0A6A3QC35_9STRA|nr:hypothetical protein PF006_g28727 [Phytophthora fragariae]